MKDAINSLRPKKPLPASQRGFPSHLTPAQHLWHLVACPALFIYLLFSPLFCLEKDSSISPPMTQVFLSAPAKSQSLFGGRTSPCPLAGWLAAGLWGVTRTHKERDVVPWLEGEMAGWSCGVWQPTKAVGLKLHPGTWLIES